MTSGLGAPTGWRRGRRSRDSCPFHFFYLNPTFLHLHVQSPPVQRGTLTGHRDKDCEGLRTLAGLPGAALSSRHRDARQEQLTADSPSHECDRHLGAAQRRAGSLPPGTRDRSQAWRGGRSEAAQACSGTWTPAAPTQADLATSPTAGGRGALPGPCKRQRGTIRTAPGGPWPGLPHLLGQCAWRCRKLLPWRPSAPRRRPGPGR